MNKPHTAEEALNHKLENVRRPKYVINLTSEPLTTPDEFICKLRTYWADKQHVYVGNLTCILVTQKQWEMLDASAPNDWDGNMVGKPVVIEL